MSTAYELTSCPVCGAGDAETVTDADGMEREREMLRARHAALLARDDGDVTDVVDFTHRPPIRVARCPECGLLYRSPRERYVRDMYEDEHIEGGTLDRLCSAQHASAAEALRRLTRLHGGSGNGLEVGPYSGAFLDAATRAGWRFTGVDVNEAVVEHLRARGFDVARGDIDAAPLAHYDAVAFWNCFDQLPDPLAALRATHARLRSGGLLAIRVPNGDFYRALRRRLDGALRAPAAALLARHNWLGFPYRHGFTAASLEHALERCGFTLVQRAGVRALPVRVTHDIVPRVAELLLQPLTGSPWLEMHARRRA